MSQNPNTWKLVTDDDSTLKNMARMYSMEIRHLNRAIPAIILAACLLFLGACSRQTCPTYSDADHVLTKWDTVPATYADVNEMIRQDTTPHRFTFIEKVAAVVCGAMIVTAIQAHNEK